MVSDQHESPGVEKRSETDRLADLWRLVYDAEVKASTCEDRVLDPHTGGCYDQLKHPVTKFNTLNKKPRKWQHISIWCLMWALYLFIIQLLQLWQGVNALLPHTFLCVRQDIRMNLKRNQSGKNKCKRQNIKTCALLYEVTVTKQKLNKTDL